MSARAETAASGRGRPGFTLIEVLVAVAIFSLAIMGVMAVFASATRSHHRGVRGMEAATIAMSVASEARAIFRERGSLRPVTDRPYPDNPRYRYDLVYIDLDRAGDEVLMRIRVRWAERGRGVALEFDTILLRKME